MWCQVTVVERRVVVLHISGGSGRCLEASRTWVTCGEQTLCKWMLSDFVNDEEIRCCDLECSWLTFIYMVELYCAGRKQNENSLGVLLLYGNLFALYYIYNLNQRIIPEILTAVVRPSNITKIC